MKHRGVICDKCGVEVTLSKVRRERFGHIELVSPCPHVWFFKGLPSRIGYLLDISMRDLERILYFEAFVVVDAGEVAVLREREVLLEDKYRELQKEYPGQFTAKMGAEAIKELLRRVEVDKLSEELREKMKMDPSLQKRIKFAKRLKVLEAFRKRSEEHTSELQSRQYLVCRLLLEKQNTRRTDGSVATVNYTLGDDPVDSLNTLPAFMAPHTPPSPAVAPLAMAPCAKF